MTTHVYLCLKRNRGWPWPDESWGLSPMFGDDGWCHNCGTPLRQQTGPLTLRRKGLNPHHGAFIPNWRFGIFCLEAGLAQRARERFRLDLRDVAWAGSPPGAALQILIPTVGASWFDPDALAAAATAEYGAPGQTCAHCGTWRWMPLDYDHLPPPQPTQEIDRHDIAASPEWFGSGCQSFREILVRRELAELIVEDSPKDFRLVEPRPH